ncbi:tetratricopeptide repeat protein [Marinoscillum sp. MHG1-6]|uniref:tetratricopeptide repeat protein n=1 Tax=Marinoscillum sp. MHG1-6 TaxID=2959627 RepID=UPI00215883A9|nr:tetratricopeptide repeat protein [Marinoscillum sp. MHG1-6]
MIRSFLFLTALWIVPFLLQGQSKQAEYLEGKRMFKQGDYPSAKSYFGSLMEDKHFGNYASFYFALCALNEGDTTQALAMWKQLLVKAPNWSGEDEVLFWLAYTSFSTNSEDSGIKYSERLARKTTSDYLKKDLYAKFLYPKPIEKIQELYKTFPEDRALGAILLSKMKTQPYEMRDLRLMKELDEKLGSEETALLSEVLPMELKDRYRIGVLLPFMYDSKNIEQILQNKAVMGLYQGMISGTQELAKKKIYLDLEPIDTKRSKDEMSKALELLPSDYLDLMVGPLLSGPFEVAKEYSKNNRVNMINPVSSSSAVIGDNPFGFLFKPTYETMALALARQAIEQFNNKNVMIFYENNDRDSVFASIYKSELEQAGFKVRWYQEIDAESAKEVMDELIAEYEDYYTQEVADSIAQLPGRFVKERRLREDELRRIKKYEAGERNWDRKFYESLPVTYNQKEEAITYYETKLKIDRDSIGHILGATSRNVLANNLISAVETMGDSTVLFGFGGYKDWLDFTMLSFSQLERNGVSIVYPEFVEYWSDAYVNKKNQLANQWKVEPSIYHMIGYELTVQVGYLMNRYGKYFQNGIRNGNYFPGDIFQGLKYGLANDNQIAPIVRFEESKLKVVNKDSYED